MNKVKFTELKKLEFNFDEIDRIWEEDLIMAQKELMKCNAKWGAKELSEKACLDGKLKTWIRDRVFRSKKSTSFWIIESREDRISKGEYRSIFDLCSKSNEEWKVKYLAKLKSKCKNFEDLIANLKLFECGIYDEDYAIDYETRKINLCKPFNFDRTDGEEISNDDVMRAKKLITFLKDIPCAKSKTQWKTFKLFWASAVQRNRSEIISASVGLGGIGKTFAMGILRALLGYGFVCITESLLNGENKFNGCLLGSSLIYLEETDNTGRNGKTMKGMKTYSTAEKIRIEMKFGESEEFNNFTNISVCTNYINDLDLNDRRMWVLNFDNGRMNDKP